MCWGRLRFLFRPSFTTIRCCDIYRDIPTWVPRLPMLRSGDCRGVRLLRMGRLVYSLLIMQILGDSSARGWRRSSGLAWNGCYLLGNTWRVWGYLDYQARVFRTLVVFHELVPRSCSTLPLLPLHLANARLELDLQFELQSLLISLLFCCFAFTPGVGLT